MFTVKQDQFVRQNWDEFTYQNRLARKHTVFPIARARLSVSLFDLKIQTKDCNVRLRRDDKKIGLFCNRQLTCWYSPCIPRRNELHNENRMPCRRRPGTTRWSRRILKQTREACSVNAGRNDILSRGLLFSRAAREKGGRERRTFSSLARVTASRRITTFCFHPLAASRSHPFYARMPLANCIICRGLAIVKKIRVPILSSGSGLADETVESIVGILGLR